MVLAVLGTILIALGLAFATAAIVGLLRMDDVYAQLHAAGLITGPALILVLLAALASGDAEIVTSALLILLFVLVTAPLAAHGIARAHHERNRERDGLVPGPHTEARESRHPEGG